MMRQTKSFFGGVYTTHTHALFALDENLKDRDASCLSIFMTGADLVQLEHHGMEIMDFMDITDAHFIEAILLHVSHNTMWTTM